MNSILYVFNVELSFFCIIIKYTTKQMGLLWFFFIYVCSFYLYYAYLGLATLIPYIHFRSCFCIYSTIHLRSCSKFITNSLPMHKESTPHFVTKRRFLVFERFYSLSKENEQGPSLVYENDASTRVCLQSPQNMLVA